MLTEIRLIAADMEDNEHQYLACPACGREGKFSITKEDGVAVYHCFRPSCTLYRGGAVRGSGSRLVRTRSEEQRRKQAFTPFTGELEPLSDEWLEYLQKEIGWEEWHVETGRPMYVPDYHRVAYPIFSPLGMRRGWSLRSYSGAEPKALTRMDNDDPHMSWYRTHLTTNTVVVVEDIPSSVRVAKYENAVALQGTGCGPDYAHEVAAHARHVLFALDADATGEAVRLQRKYGLMFESATTLVLPKDFKDMNEDEIKEVLNV